MGLLRSTSCFYLLLNLVFLSQFPIKSHSQQAYRGRWYSYCNNSISEGYECNGPVSCRTFIAFRARFPHNNAVSIADLLGSEVSDIVSINKVSEMERLPEDRLVMVPISCSCWGKGYLHFLSKPYIMQENDTYYKIANETFQGLTTCSYVWVQNDRYVQDNVYNLSVGTSLMIPVRCACSSTKQSAEGVSFLLVYMVEFGDSIASIGKKFGVSEESIMKANMISANDIIYPFTPLLIPLKYESCSVNPSFYCKADDKRLPVKLVALLGVGISFGTLSLALLGYKLYKYQKERKHRIRKENLFKQNGGLLLKERYSSGASHWKATVFSAEEIERATDNFNVNRFLGQGGYGTVYKGMLLDGTIVAVKRARAVDRSQIEQFINEIVILSQINHRNVVKLVGCCLETEFPLLIYEFIPNGTLSSHIYQPDPEVSLPWESRLRIAAEVAGAVAYMHSASSIPIFHRDIKSSNILLDDQYGAKVSDFGTSRSVSVDKSHLTTGVKGTFGYLDPEYFLTSQFTAKSDVYSFGVVLLELLTGEKPISFSRAETERNLIGYFRTSWEENRMLAIIDPRVSREAKKEDILATADLAMRCLRQTGIERPLMKEVATELDVLSKSQRRLPPCQEIQRLNFEDIEDTTDDNFNSSSDLVSYQSRDDLV